MKGTTGIIWPSSDCLSLQHVVHREHTFSASLLPGVGGKLAWLSAAKSNSESLPIRSWHYCTQLTVIPSESSNLTSINLMNNNLASVYFL